MIPLYEVHTAVNSYSPKTECWLSGPGQWRQRELPFNEYRVSVQEDDKIFEMDGGNGYTTMRMYLVPLYCIFKMVK